MTNPDRKMVSTDDQQEDVFEFDGHISLSSKGFHCDPQIYDYWGNPLGFVEGRFVTSLTQVFHVSEGPEILTPFNSLELHVYANINTGEEWEYVGEILMKHCCTLCSTHRRQT